MKVCHVIADTPGDGAQNALLRLIKLAHDRGTSKHSVIVLMSGGSISEQLTRAGASVSHLGLPRRPDPRMVLRLRRELRRADNDITQSWLYHANVAAACCEVLRRNAPPLVWCIRHALHDFSAESRVTRWTLRLSKRLARQANVIVYNSVVAQRHHRAFGILATHDQVIPNGISLSDQHKSDRSIGPLTIGRHARWHPIKGMELLIDAVRIARRDGANINLKLCGAGVCAGVESYCGPQDWIHTDPETASPLQWLAGVDVWVSSSHGESFPNALLEAMSVGLPCISTNVGDCAACLNQEEWIVEPGDAVGLASKLVAMSERPFRERQQIGLLNRARAVDQYSIERMLSSYELLWSSLG
jgi:glycosyltransferase involved in cell wall biosynthesis